MSIVLCEAGDGCPGGVAVSLTCEDGCELSFRHDEAGWILHFPCSLSALLGVELGARTHIASEFGMCEMREEPDCFVFILSPSGAAAVRYTVARETLIDAVRRLTVEAAEMKRGRAARRKTVPR